MMPLHQYLREELLQVGQQSAFSCAPELASGLTKDLEAEKLAYQAATIERIQKKYTTDILQESWLNTIGAFEPENDEEVKGDAAEDELEALDIEEMLKAAADPFGADDDSEDEPAQSLEECLEENLALISEPAVANDSDVTKLVQMAVKKRN